MYVTDIFDRNAIMKQWSHNVWLEVQNVSKNSKTGLETHARQNVTS